MASDFTLLSIMVFDLIIARNIQKKINTNKAGYLCKHNLKYFFLQNVKVRLYAYPKQIQFFRKIILKGDFQESISFLKTLEGHLEQRIYKKACLVILKQKLYELIDIPNQKQLKKLFEKQIGNFCNQDQYQELFTLLTCRKAQQIQGLSDWTILKGRLHAFEQLLPIIEIVLYNNQRSNNYNYLTAISSEEEINLDEAIAIYLQNKGNLINLKNSGLPSQANGIQTLNKINVSPKGSQLNIIQNKQSNILNNNSQPLQNNSLLKSGAKQIQLQLSQSQYEKSHQFGAGNLGGVDKKSRLYVNSLSNIKENESQPLIKENQSLLKNISVGQRSNLGKQVNFSHNHSNNKAQYSGIGSKLYQQQQINEISEQQQRSDTVRSNNNNRQNNQTLKATKNSQLNVNRYVQPQNSESSDLEQSSRQNIEYLEQTNSVVYNNQLDRQHQNFTFSHHNFHQGEVQETVQNTENQKPRQILKLATISDNKAIRTCQFSNSGNFFAVGTNSSILKIFQVEQLYLQNKQQQLSPIYQIFSLHSKSIFSLDWSKDQSSMVTCSNDLTIKLTEFSNKFSSHSVSVIGRHQSCIRMVKFNEAQNKIFSCGDDSLVKVWDMGKVKRCYNLKGHSAGISAFKLGSNQNELFSVSKDSTIKRWDLRTLECIATSKEQESQMTFIANNTQKIVASNKNGNVLFFNQQLNLQYEVKIHEQEIRSIQASKSQDLYLTASFDGHVSMFSQKSIHSPDYFQHNQNSEDKVVFATFLDHSQYKGFASTSTLGLCHIYSYY